MNKHSDLVLLGYLFKVGAVLIVFVSAFMVAATGEVSYLFLGVIVAIQIYLVGAFGHVLVDIATNIHINTELGIRQYKERDGKRKSTGIKSLKDAS
jgi:hypothetical protein